MNLKKSDMKKSILIKGSFFVLAFAVAWACSDSFLDKKPLGVYDQSALANNVGVNAQLIATYHMLSGYNIDNANTWAANPANWILGSVPSDDAYKGSESTDDVGGITQTETYNWTASMIDLSDKYIPSYEGVRRANTTLALLAAAKDVPSAKADVIKGEALFLRAWFHFELYKVFTNIPYYRENDYGNYKKTNVGVDVVAECIADMTAAQALLPVTQSDIGRVNQIAADAFLGKLYMYKNDYANAKTQFAKVIAARTLNPCFKTIFTMAGENSSESIFSVQANINDNNQARNANWLNQLAYPVGPTGVFGCCGYHQPSQNLVNAYRTDAITGLPLKDDSSDQIPDATVAVDPRLDLTVGRDNVPYLDYGVHDPSWIRSRSYSGPYSPKKYMQYKSDPASTGGWNANATSAVNIQLIRLSDVMLMMAEADVETSDIPGALLLVNQVRTRAANCAQGTGTTTANALTNTLASASAYANYKIGNYTAFASQDIAREAVRLERRLELALEGHRFFDLRRYTKMDPAFNPSDINHFYMKKVLDNFTTTEANRANPVTKRGYYAQAAKIEEKHLNYPLPANQVNLSFEGGTPSLVQNPGW